MQRANILVNHSGSLWKAVTSLSNKLMDTLDHATIQKMGSEFLQKNNWSSL